MRMMTITLTMVQMRVIIRTIVKMKIMQEDIPGDIANNSIHMDRTFMKFNFVI